MRKRMLRGLGAAFAAVFAVSATSAQNLPSIPIDSLPPATSVNTGDRLICQQGQVGSSSVTKRCNLSDVVNISNTLSVVTGIGSFNVTTNNIVWQPSSPGSVTFTLPANPALNEIHNFADYGANSVQLIIAPNTGQTLLSPNGAVANVALGWTGQFARVRFVGNSTWVLENLTGPIGGDISIPMGGNTATVLQASTSFNVSGVISPTALSGDVNDYNPTGISTATTVRIDGGGADRNITGIQAPSSPAEGRLLYVINVGATNNLILKNNSGSSASGNRFQFGSDTALPVGKAVVLRYDSTTGAWRPAASVLPDSGVAAGTYGGGVSPQITVLRDGRISAISGAGGTSPSSAISATNTNDNAASGFLGEFASASDTNFSSTVTITIASPAVVSFTNHGLNCASALYFTTTGALPTGITANTNYYVTCGASLQTNSFQISTSVANAIAGTSVNTSGTQSGTQTALGPALLSTGVPTDIAAVSLAGGDWECRGSVQFVPNGATTISSVIGWLNTASATPPGVGAAIPFVSVNATMTTGTTQRMSLAQGRFPSAGTQTIFLSVQSGFGVNTMNAGGRIECRRPR